jgi:hypothetical protein
MKTRNYLAMIFLCALGASLVQPVHADESRETVKFTFSGPVEIPGHALQAGTYIFETLDSEDLPDIIQIYNADHTALIATLQTIPVWRGQPSGDPAITLAQQDDGRPAALVDWFYGDRLTGHMFLYSKQQENKLAQAKQDTFVGDHLVSAGQTVGE